MADGNGHMSVRLSASPVGRLPYPVATSHAYPQFGDFLGQVASPIVADAGSCAASVGRVPGVCARRRAAVDSMTLIKALVREDWADVGERGVGLSFAIHGRRRLAIDKDVVLAILRLAVEALAAHCKAARPEILVSAIDAGACMIFRLTATQNPAPQSEFAASALAPALWLASRVQLDLACDGGTEVRLGLPVAAHRH